MKNALAYYRVSSLGQVQGDGFPRQRATCQKYAKQNGVVIVEEYSEEGVSGTTDGLERPSLSALFAAIKSTGIKLVLVENASRLARDLLVSEIILQEFRKVGVEVVACDSGASLADDSAPEKILIRQILGAISSFDRSVIVSKLRAARDRKSAALGRRIEGRKPIGTHSHEQQVVARIFQLHRKPKGKPRLTYAQIADQLNAEGIAPRAGTKWHPSVVYRIINRRA